MKQILSVLIPIVLFTFAGCSKSDSYGPASPKEGPASLSADSTRTLSVNNFSVQVDRLGRLQQGVWNNNGKNVYVISLAGLWVGMQQNGEPVGDITWAGEIPHSNYTSTLNGNKLGVYYVEAGGSYDATGWPSDYGAPATAGGSPAVHGDAMCWSALTSDTTLTSEPIFSEPVKNIRITQTVYAYNRSSLQNVIFVRYEITNTGSNSMNGVYLGFYSDTDLGDAQYNRTGYDSARELTYTYQDSVNSSGYSYATGFTFLETPGNAGVTSHRIMRKDNYINPDFGEYGFNMPKQILYALQGLSNSGKPMVNPTTGQNTLFAFTGDPVERTGWLDNKIDVRSMISSGPFNLAPNQTVKITVAWAVNGGADLFDAIGNLKNKIDLVRSDKSLWQFN